jgi:hypothetical protein
VPPGPGKREEPEDLDTWLEDLGEEDDPTAEAERVPSLLDDDLLDDLDDLLVEPRRSDTLDEFVVEGLHPVDDVPTDFDITDEPFVEELMPDITAILGTRPETDLPVLPWSTTASIVDLAPQVPAILDPTRERSEWSTPVPPLRGITTATIRVGPLSVRVELLVSNGPESVLRIGRDVLAGRAVVSALRG